MSKCLFCVEMNGTLSGQFQHDPATRRQMHSFKIALLNIFYNSLLSLAIMLYRPETAVSTCLVLIHPHHYRGKRQYLQYTSGGFTDSNGSSFWLC